MIELSYTSMCKMKVYFFQCFIFNSPLFENSNVVSPVHGQKGTKKKDTITFIRFEIVCPFSFKGFAICKQHETVTEQISGKNQFRPFSLLGTRLLVHHLEDWKMKEKNKLHCKHTVCVLNLETHCRKMIKLKDYIFFRKMSRKKSHL